MRALISAYACEPGKGSEPGVGWNWVVQAASVCDEVTVVTRANNRDAIESGGAPANVRFIYLELSDRLLSLKRGARRARLYYVMWQRAVAGEIERLQRESPHDVVHHLTWASISLPIGSCAHERCPARRGTRRWRRRRQLAAVAKPWRSRWGLRGRPSRTSTTGLNQPAAASRLETGVGHPRAEPGDGRPIAFGREAADDRRTQRRRGGRRDPLPDEGCDGRRDDTSRLRWSPHRLEGSHDGDRGTCHQAWGKNLAGCVWRGPGAGEGRTGGEQAWGDIFSSLPRGRKPCRSVGRHGSRRCPAVPDSARRGPAGRHRGHGTRPSTCSTGSWGAVSVHWQRWPRGTCSTNVVPPGTTGPGMWRGCLHEPGHGFPARAGVRLAQQAWGS